MTTKWRPAPFELGFITQTFRNSADNDYIAARLLYCNGLDQQFLWSAEQAVEKYLKAILLYNGINTADIGHLLTRAFDRLDAITDIQFDLSRRYKRLPRVPAGLWNQPLPSASVLHRGRRVASARQDGVAHPPLLRLSARRDQELQGSAGRPFTGATQANSEPAYLGTTAPVPDHARPT